MVGALNAPDEFCINMEGHAEGHSPRLQSAIPRSLAVMESVEV